MLLENEMFLLYNKHETLRILLFESLLSWSQCRNKVFMTRAFLAIYILASEKEIPSFRAAATLQFSSSLSSFFLQFISFVALVSPPYYSLFAVFPLNSNLECCNAVCITQSFFRIHRCATGSCTFPAIFQIHPPQTRE